MTLNLDDTDAAAIHRAIAVHQAQRVDGQHVLPDGESGLRGAIVAEICRDWLEARGLWPAAGESGEE